MASDFDVNKPSRGALTTADFDFSGSQPAPDRMRASASSACLTDLLLHATPD
jgi:hypothetical protein